MGGPEFLSVSTAPAVGDRDLRVSDAEREHVGQLLQRAVGLGMLSLGEFTERMDSALAAKTRGELNVVLVDLPGMRVHGAPQPAAMPRPARRATPVGTDPTMIRSRLSSVHRRGAWQVPPVLHLHNLMSSIELDFTEAVMQTQIVEIAVDDYLSGLTLIVPPAATVDLNGLELIGSGVNNRVRTGPPIGPLHLVVHGRIRWGSVTAKYPLMTQLRRAFGRL
ncbi:DUF1707 SHOCT-like domain-containing protein [Nocardia camponoti]|uniref:DUF1707 domain-containing protein n=1 Tax=Nocardia camponoti TaxID=1616106 RepID=A0A917QJ72_9NOCA|nr:DUF1707 domain-containing protein [Nocardia camponoti]GGK53028.1 hypothetical protein GCM10011591_25980 [Nocardia camponoti]